MRSIQMEARMTSRPKKPSAASINGLFNQAKAASKKAYARYSKFHVGAAVLTAAGKTYTGCNVENVSYPLGTCAEADAIAAARVAEGAAFKIAALAVYAEKEGQGHQPCTPCGGCRQRIFEFGPQADVWFYDRDRKRLRATAMELLPHAFEFEPPE
jgi:cytidine deaminase